jgi:virginiamycin B lyase
MAGALLLCAAAPSPAAEPATEPAAKPAAEQTAAPASVDPADGSVPITLLKCGGSAFVQGRRGGARIDVNYEIHGTKTADAVEFLMRNDFGPRYAVGVRAKGTFSPGVPIHDVLTADAPADIGPWSVYPNHCAVTYVHFTDGTELRAQAAFMAAERPEVIGEFGLPQNSRPRGIAVAADGSLWVVEERANAIAHVDAGNGKVLGEFPIPTAHADPRYIARGAGGTMWFTEFRGAKVGTIASDGTIREFAVGCTGCHPGPLAVDANGNAWFAEMNIDTDATAPGMPTTIGANVIGRVTPDGIVSEFPVPTKQSYPTALFVARDGTIWFTESAGKIGHMASDGKILVELPVAGERPWWIGEDANGALHALSTDPRAVRVGYSTISRTADGGYRKVAKFAPLPGRITLSSGAFDGKGNVWFTDMVGNRVVRMNEGGRAEELNLGVGGAKLGTYPSSIAAGDDGTLWVVEVVTDRIVHIRPH